MEFPTLIGPEWKKDIGIGLLVGAAFVIINALAPSIAIGIPSVGLSVGDSGRFIVVALLAPIIEEIFFRGAVLTFLSRVNLPRFISPLFLPIILSSLTFSLYHLSAYGGSIASASGAFTGAILFGIIATMLVLWRKNTLPSTIAHSIFNIFLLSKLSVVLG